MSGSKAIPRLFASSTGAGYTVLPLNDLSTDGHPTTADLKAEDGRPTAHQGRVRISVLGAAIAAVSLRLELYRQVNKKTECTVNSLEIYLPLLLAMYDAVRFQKADSFEVSDRHDGTIYEAAQDTVKRYIIHGRFRYILSVAVFCHGCSILLNQWLPLNTTYICPVVLDQYSVVFWMQVGCLVLDFALAILLYEMLPRKDGFGLSPNRNVVLWSLSLTGAAVVWTVVGMVVYISKPEYRFWILLMDSPHFFSLLMSIVIQSVLASTFCITTLHSILVYGVLSMSLDLAAVLILEPSVLYIWSMHQPYPPTSATITTFAFLLIYLGWWTLHYVQHQIGVEEHQVSRTKLRVILLLILVAPSWFKKGSMYYHPIDLLIYEGNRQHEAYYNATQLSRSLSSTVATYKQKYGRNPPPGFDVWWEYARNRSTLILDEYDQIFEDVHPFYSLPAEAIRKQTWEMVSNPWNEISGHYDPRRCCVGPRKRSANT